MKIKVFAWLMISDRLNTMDMLDQHHCARENDDLILCLGEHRETRQHLFFTRPFSGGAGSIWVLIGTLI